MAAQVLSGSGNVTYTNSTGQNVRVVINYFEVGGLGGTPIVSFAGCSITVEQLSIYGKTLAYQSVTGDNNVTSSMAAPGVGGSRTVKGLPLEIALSNGDTFSITSSNSANIKGYNIVIIPEAG